VPCKKDISNSGKGLASTEMANSSPFRYPKSKHKRRLAPPQRKSYRAFKPFLRKEFDGRCVYCALPDLLKGQDSFGVDHYRPQSAFPSLITEYNNLFYACNACNSRKRQFWPTPKQWEKGHFVPNPCDHVMYQHLRAANAVIQGRTETGRFSIDLLDLNDPASVEYRKLVLDVCKIMSRELKSLRETQKQLQAQIRDCKDMSRKGELESEREDLEADVRRIDEHLSQLLLYDRRETSK